MHPSITLSIAENGTIFNYGGSVVFTNLNYTDEMNISGSPAFLKMEKYACEQVSYWHLPFGRDGAS